MLYKKDIINFLYVISFPVAGLGSYVQGNVSPSIGSFLVIAPHILIILFYLIDSLYKRTFNFRPNGLFVAVILFLLVGCYSAYVGIVNSIPFYTKPVAIGRMAVTLIPFPAFIAVFLYNGRDIEKVIKLTFISLTSLLMLNMVGFYGLGLKNAIHSIEGRINFPFIDSFYSGSGLCVILNLMILYYMRKSNKQPLYFTRLLLFFCLNLVIIYLINSRLQVLVFLLTMVLIFFGVGLRSKLMYFFSILFIPLLLNFAMLVYQVLSLPAFEALLLRVSMRDVLTFNGRAQLWQTAMDWLVNDRTGFWFGNGHKGHYVLGLLEIEARRWKTEPYQMHLHSTALELLVSTGVIGYGLFIFIMYKCYVWFGKQYTRKRPEGIFLFVMIFFIWVLQIDLLLYFNATLNIFLCLLWAMVTVHYKQPEVEPLIPEVLKVSSGNDNGSKYEPVY